MLERQIFLDETSLKTNLVKTTGWAPVGERLIGHAPFGHWNTQTFIAALRHDRLDAPWVIDGPINRDLFNLYVETQLVPTLRRGDVLAGIMILLTWTISPVTSPQRRRKCSKMSAHGSYTCHPILPI